MTMHMMGAVRGFLEHMRRFADTIPGLELHPGGWSA